MRKTIATILFISFFITVPVQAVSLESFEALLVRNQLQPTKQAVCIENSTGTELSYNAQMPVVPASVTKLYITDFALSKLPLDFRYTTTFYRVGDTLYINGGGDSHFLDTHLASAITALNNEGMVPLKYFVISPNFYFNWLSDRQDVQTAVFRFLKSNKTLPIAPKIEVILSNKPYQGAGERFEFKSMPLPALLKQINDYSNNLGAEALFTYLGGAPALVEYIRNTYGANSSTFYFGTGSGLRNNYTTCNLTIQMLKHLRGLILSNNLKLTDILTVPVIDPGVMKYRLIDTMDAQSIVAKSGFIKYHHTLAGIISTDEGPVYFGIFTEYNDLARGNATKTMIDKFLRQVLDDYRPILKSYNYRPNFSLNKDVLLRRI